MTHQVIPAEAVEVAAKWMHDNDCRSALHSGFPADFECYDWMEEARELLEAAAPHMRAGDRAEVWAEGHEDGFWNGRMSPEGTGVKWPTVWLLRTREGVWTMTEAEFKESLRAAKQEAWEEGATAADGKQYLLDDNPYRPTP